MSMDIEQSCYDLVRKGDLQGLKSAIETGVKVCDLMPYDQSLVLHAVLSNQIDILRFLIEQGCDLNKGDKAGLTPLQGAAQMENLQAARLLLAGHARVDTEDSYGNTPLMDAVFVKRGDPEMISLLLEYGADPFHENKSGISPYSFAQKTQKRDVVALFDKA